MASKKKIKKIKFQTFQDTILNLQKYWIKHGCVILQPYDMEVGAGTFHPATALGKQLTFSLQEGHRTEDMETIQIDYSIIINFKLLLNHLPKI